MLLDQENSACNTDKQYLASEPAEKHDIVQASADFFTWNILILQLAALLGLDINNIYNDDCTYIIIINRTAYSRLRQIKINIELCEQSGSSRGTDSLDSLEKKILGGAL